MTSLKRKIAAIMAADIAGYSRLVAEDEEETLRRLGAYRAVFDDFVARAGGRIFNTAGDAVMCEFASAVEATRCAIDIQESLRTRNMAYPPSRQMHFRIGIAIGDVVERDGDLLGDGVNIAARLEGLAEPGGICVARNVHEAVANKVSVPFRDLGEREVKNIPQPVHAFMVDIWRSEKLVAPKRPERAAPDRTREKSPLRQGIRAVLLLALGVWLLAGPVRDWLGRTPQQASVPGTPPPPPGSTPAPPPVPPTTPDPPPRAGEPLDIRPPGQRSETAVPATEGMPPAEAFALLARSGGLVQAPRTAAELYHNARLHEARGDAVQARRDYLALAQRGGDAIDPHLRFATLLRVQDGRAGAREVYSGLATRGRAAALVYALQFEGDERRRRIEAFAAENPDYAPAQYFVAEEHGEERRNMQTNAEKKREQAALARFLQADAEGTLVPFFLDQSVLGEWLDRARRRSEALRAHFARPLVPTAQFVRTNSSWLMTLILPEPATSIAYRIGGQGEFRPTGFLQASDPRTGRPIPNPSVELPPGLARTAVEIRYTDVDGQVSEPASIAFDPTLALFEGQKDILVRFPQNWVAFGDGSNGGNLYFTQLVSYRCALERAEVFFDGQEPARALPIPPCDPRNPHAIPPGARTFVALPDALRSVSVRLTFADGAESDLQVFARP